MGALIDNFFFILVAIVTNIKISLKLFMKTNYSQLFLIHIICLPLQTNHWVNVARWWVHEATSQRVPANPALQIRAVTLCEVLLCIHTFGLWGWMPLPPHNNHWVNVARWWVHEATAQRVPADTAFTLVNCEGGSPFSKASCWPTSVVMQMYLVQYCFFILFNVEMTNSPYWLLKYDGTVYDLYLRIKVKLT